MNCLTAKPSVYPREVVIEALKHNIASATSVPRSQAPCYELDYAKVIEFDSDGSIDMSNVVLMPVQASVPESVPSTLGDEAETSLSP